MGATAYKYAKKYVYLVGPVIRELLVDSDLQTPQEMSMLCIAITEKLKYGLTYSALWDLLIVGEGIYWHISVPVESIVATTIVSIVPITTPDHSKSLSWEPDNLFIKSGVFKPLHECNVEGGADILVFLSNWMDKYNERNASLRERVHSLQDECEALKEQLNKYQEGNGSKEAPPTSSTVAGYETKIAGLEWIIRNQELGIERLTASLPDRDADNFSCESVVVKVLEQDRTHTATVIGFEGECRIRVGDTINIQCVRMVGKGDPPPEITIPLVHAIMKTGNRISDDQKIRAIDAIEIG